MLLSLLIRRRRALALASACTLLAAGPATAGWQGAPDILRLENVGDEIQVNGTPMMVRRFETDQPVDAILGYFSQEWSNEASARPVKRTKLGPWTVLNQDIGDRHRSLQVREQGPGALEGLLAVTSPTMHKEPVLTIRLPADFAIVSVVDSSDQGRSAQQIMARSNQSLTNIDNALEAQLRMSGWSSPQRRKTATSLMISANRGDAQFDAIINANAGGALGIFNVVGASRP